MNPAFTAGLRESLPKIPSMVAKQNSTPSSTMMPTSRPFTPRYPSVQMTAPMEYPAPMYSPDYQSAYMYPQPMSLLPYGSPYMSATPYYQPIAYFQTQPMIVPYPVFVPPSQQTTPSFTPFKQSRSKRHDPLPKITNFGYSTAATAPAVDTESDFEALDDTASLSSEASKREKLLDVHMGVDELFINIRKHLNEYSLCRVSWLNRMLAKCNTRADFAKAVEILYLFQTRAIEATSETGTLLIKAACRANIPEKALEMLQSIDEYRLFPTLGGIHYLMINFALRKDTDSVMKTFAVTKLRYLKPNARTYHILIRECVDHDLIEEATLFAQECKASNLIPSRVTYNILMNGYRKHNMAAEILELRSEMDANQIELNDTTIKFTALAHMLQGNTEKAVASFLEYSKLGEKNVDDFALKFFEVIPEDNRQKQCVVDLFKALRERGTKLPETVESKIAELETSLKASSS